MGRARSGAAVGDETRTEFASYRRQAHGLRPPLVDVPRARETDPTTSHQAAAAIKASGALGEQQRDAVQIVRLFPGRTTSELAKLKVDELGAEGSWEKWRHIFGRRLSDLKNVHVEARAPRRCAVTGRQAATWWSK